MANMAIAVMSLMVLAPAALAQNQKKVTVWLHQNNWYQGVWSLETNAHLAAEASPAWYQVQPDGSVQAREGAFVDDEYLKDLVNKNGILLRPIIGNVSTTGSHPEWIRPMLLDEGLRNAHAEVIINLVLAKNYDGVDLDYEGLLPSELPGLASLVETVSGRLHNSGKTVAVSIETTMAEGALVSWKRLGEAADSVRLMLYSEHHGRTNPGPAASLCWARQRLNHVLKVVPREKLAAGFLITAMSWDNGSFHTGTWLTMVLPALDLGTAVSRYTDGNIPYLKNGAAEIWYEDELSMAAKLAMVKDFELTRVALWRLGGEDQGIWRALLSF